MFKMTTVLKSICTMILFLLAVQNTFAADKVVVIPMKANTPKLITAYNHKISVPFTEWNENVINSVNITVPIPGTIIASSTVNLWVNANDLIGCGIYSTTSYKAEYANTLMPYFEQLYRGIIANIRHFQVNAGSHTIYQICYKDGSLDAIAFKSDLSLLFVPN